MKKFYKLTIALIVFALIAGGCAAKNGKANVSIDDINNKIKAAADISGMTEGDAKKLKKWYGIDESKLDGFKLYRADSNVKADELLIVKIKNSEDTADIKDKISKRIDKQASSFKDYLPEEYDLVRNNVVKESGSFLLFAVSKDAEKIGKAFDEVVK